MKVAGVYLWFFGVFRTKNTESFTVDLLLRVVIITKQVPKRKYYNEKDRINCNSSKMEQIHQLLKSTTIKEIFHDHSMTCDTNKICKRKRSDARRQSMFCKLYKLSEP